MKKLKGKNVLLYGGKGAIGSYISQALLEAGAKITIFSRNEAELRAFANTLGEPDRVLIVAGSASVPEDLRRAVSETQQKFGEIDAFVIAVGTWAPLPVNSSLEEARASFDKMYELIFRPSAMAAWSAQETLMAQGNAGKIFHISSHAAVRPFLLKNASYVAMKGAVSQLMRNLHYETEGTGIRVVDIQPAAVNTPENADLLDTEEKRRNAVQPEEIGDLIVKRFNRKRKKKPEEILMDTKDGSRW